MREETESFDEAISGSFTRLQQSFAPRNDGKITHAIIPPRGDIKQYHLLMMHLLYN
ncbi:hypothetical protein [Rickettsia endosymbiont of Lasioglossum villosulum]|uniref:hypothetical protein n=1 Tax=Rickettsia endosymbiont of Lasioglossum villosulum TaxID=3066269 RepID=UPI003132F9C2